MTKTETASFPYQYANKIADKAFDLLQPHCDIIHKAGSISREKEFVKDIEIVCLPKKEFVPTDLFGGGIYQTVPGFKVVIDYIKKETVKGNTDGRYMQVILKGDIKMDLFMPAKEDYYRQLVIRTGSADYSHKVIAARWTELGWVGTYLGLRRRSDCYPKRDNAGKIISWIVNNPDGDKPPVWISEKDFFEWLGVMWIEPRYR